MALVCVALGGFIVAILAFILYWLVIRDEVMAAFQDARDEIFPQDETEGYEPSIDEMYVDGNGDA